MSVKNVRAYKCAQLQNFLYTQWLKQKLEFIKNQPYFVLIKKNWNDSVILY